MIRVLIIITLLVQLYTRPDNPIQLDFNIELRKSLHSNIKVSHASRI